MGKTNDTEAQVKKHLTKIKQIDGGWHVMLDILWRRRIIAMLKEARIGQGLTQAQIAERMGITQGRVAEIENDPWPDPYVSTLARYATALGLEFHIEATPLPDLTEPEDDEGCGLQGICIKDACADRCKDAK